MIYYILAFYLLVNALILLFFVGCSKQERRQHDEDLLAPYKGFNLIKREREWRTR